MIIFHDPLCSFFLWYGPLRFFSIKKKKAFWGYNIIFRDPIKKPTMIHKQFESVFSNPEPEILPDFDPNKRLPDIHHISIGSTKACKPLGRSANHLVGVQTTEIEKMIKNGTQPNPQAGTGVSCNPKITKPCIPLGRRFGV